jgi:hypothetical protein
MGYVKQLMSYFYLLTGILTVQTALSQEAANEEEVSTPRNVAIFTANRAGAELNDQLPIFEDLLAAKVTGEGFSVISRDVALSAVGDLTKRSKRNELDKALDDQTSALRLAQSLNADYILLATILGHDTSQRHVNVYGISVINENHILRTTYRVIDGNTGGSLVADTAEAKQLIQQSERSVTVNPGLFRDLLSDASSKISASLLAKVDSGKLREVKLSDAQVEFALAVSLADVNFPEIVEEPNGTMRLTANRGIAQAVAVTVELDGMVIGTTGTAEMLPKFKVSPGLHRLRLSREGLVDWERNINIRDGMTLNVSMQLDEEGLRRWRENTAIFNQMKKDAILTAAEADRIRGAAQMLRQSGIRVNIDSNEDIKVDTKEPVRIENNQGLIQPR